MFTLNAFIYLDKTQKNMQKCIKQYLYKHIKYNMYLEKEKRTLKMLLHFQHSPFNKFSFFKNYIVSITNMYEILK